MIGYLVNAIDGDPAGLDHGRVGAKQRAAIDGVIAAVPFWLARKDSASWGGYLKAGRHQVANHTALAPFSTFGSVAFSFLSVFR